MSNERGFSLIEILLTVAAFGAVMLMLTVLLSNMLSTNVKTQAFAEVDFNGQFIVEKITQAVRNAQTLQGPTAGQAAAVLTLGMAASADNPTIFDLSNGVVRMKEGSAPALALSSSKVTVSNFVVTNLSRPDTRGMVNISFTVSHLNPTGRQELLVSKDFYASASLR